MANLREELAAALPGLHKAVFSQPADKLSDQKVTVRPVRIKGKLSYQVERFRDNKAFHQNLDDTALLSLVDNELEGHYRQVLIVGERESAQYVLRQKGGYKKTGRSAAKVLYSLEKTAKFPLAGDKIRQTAVYSPTGLCYHLEMQELLHRKRKNRKHWETEEKNEV